MSDSVDLVISGGTIVDGTGAPGRPGTVIVEGDRMRVLPVEAPLPEHAGRRIDATDRIVAPGFIDLHSHGGLVILAEPRHEPKVRQGVTTEIVGVDGNGFAPFERKEDLDAFVEMDSGLDGRPPIDFDWLTVADYLARFDGAVSVNVGTLVGNSQLRIAALGWDDVPADDRAIDTMRAVLRDAMADGAVGLSSGLDYPPGSYASTDELAALTRTAREAGGFYHTHVRYQLGDRYLDPFREAIEIGRRAEGPTHLTHFYHRRTHPGGPDALLRLVDDARAEGLDVTFDTYPSEWASTRLLIQLPGWIQAGGPAPLKTRLADRSARDRLRQEIGASPSSAAAWADVRLGAFRRPDLLRWESHTM
ncbi:MAG: amidohydrolase family protein, partial [Candidatus Limnocylindrales bacterium]